VVNLVDGKEVALQADAATGTTDINTNSVPYVDMTDMAITMVTGANPVLVLFQGTFHSDIAGRIMSLTIDIDGTDMIEVGKIFPAGNVYHPVGLKWMSTLTAGSHTFKIQWRTNAGTITQNAATTGYDRHMIVIELL